MFPPLPVRHSWSLSDSEGHGPAWYKRVTKRFVQYCRRKRHKFDARLAAKTKQTLHTSSDNGNDDGEPIRQDMTYKALSLVIKSGYPVGSILGRGTLYIQQNVLNTTSGDLWGLGPALRIGPFPLLDLVPKSLGVSTGDQSQYKAAAGGPSGQKRPPGSPGKPGSNNKKPRKENRQSSDKAHDNADNNGDGGGDGEGDSSRDGPRFPHPQDFPDRKSFSCPFYESDDPARYYRCKGHHATSISYVTQHILRRHVLKQCTMDVQETAKSTSTGDNSAYLLKTTDSDKIVFYCPTCRDEFRGRGADVRFERHPACQAKSIAQTGVLLPAEFDELKKEVTATSGDDNKWDKICTTLYPGNLTATQYSNLDTVAPIGVDVQPHNTIPHHPFVGAVNEAHRHDPPQVFGPQMPDHVQLPDPYLENDGFLYLFQDCHGDMENNIGNLDYATSHIPNLAPPNETMFGSRPLNPNIIQNPQFPNNTWAQNNYHGTS